VRSTVKSMSGIKGLLSTAWGSDRGRAFRVGSWVAALVAFGAWTQYDVTKPVVKQVKNAPSPKDK
jgi:hypothetical protein